MTHVSPLQSSPVFNSAADLGAQVNEYSPLPDHLRRKKRSKKQQGSPSNPDRDHQPPNQHSPIDLDTSVHGSKQYQHELIEDDAGINSAFSSSLAQSQQKKGKKERRESRRAAKLVKQQQALATSSPLENTEASNRSARLWNSQEHASVAEAEPQEEEGEDREPEANMEEAYGSPNAASKKRKRRRSHNQTEDALQQSLKRRKNSHSGAVTITQEHDESTHNDPVSVAEGYNNSDINLNDLAERLYSGRKRRSQRDATREESGLTTETRPEHKEPTHPADVSGRMEDNLSGNGLREDEAADEVEIRQGIDGNDALNNDNSVSRASEATSAAHIITTSQSSPPFGGRNELTNNTHDDGPDVTGADQSMNTEAVSSLMSSTADGYVEIPSSIPLPPNAREPRVTRSAASKTSTGKKRMAKPDFFTRLVDEIDESPSTPSTQSPSTAALSRRKYKGKSKEADAYEAQTGSSSAKRKARQPTVTSKLNNKIDMTPSTGSAVGVYTTETPVTSTGALTDVEIRSLNKAINQFKDEHEVTQYRVNELIQGNPKEAEANELWKIIMEIFPGRNRQKVINQTRRRFHNFVARGTWTPEQDQELRQMYEQYGNKYSLVGQLINRHPEDIRDRIRNYTICGSNLRRDQWSQEETDQLIAIVDQASAEIHKQRALQGEQSNLPIEEDINWQLVSQGMGRTRSRLQCIARWKVIKTQMAGGSLDGETAPIGEMIQQARDAATTMSYRNRSFVVKAILKTGAKADNRIPWVKVRHELGGQWTRPPLMVVWFRLKRSIPDWQSLNVEEICTILLQRFKQSHKLEYPTDESGDLDYDLEYREIERKIRRHRRAKQAPKSAASISKASDDEDVDEDEEKEEDGEREDEEVEEANLEEEDQPNTAAEEAVEEEEEEEEGSRVSPSRSVDLGIGSGEEKVHEVEDSEPEVHTRHHRRRRSIRIRGTRPEPRNIQPYESDDQSSDTNASQVSSIPAR
ncbi:hypothetical protein ONZ43_g6368 [Nemania bipapillata]|uniref:Uncharacterized protein n=1 Tax=Nemania bipapillata TaxID=110536 RepID=A0ACC2I084_9PEZI|nr:hypothetical protein ONZ43_g6368 [Nemania bipapillata]